MNETQTVKKGFTTEIQVAPKRADQKKEMRNNLYLLWIELCHLKKKSLSPDHQCLTMSLYWEIDLCRFNQFKMSHKDGT